MPFAPHTVDVQLPTLLSQASKPSDAIKCTVDVPSDAQSALQNVDYSKKDTGSAKSIRDSEVAPVNDLLERARKVFPGVKYTRGTLAEPWADDERFPVFLNRGKGCRVWDVQGREFIDYLSSFGAQILGYGEERVEKAAIAAAEETGGHLLPGPTRFSVELAEKLVQLRAGATWALLAKNGSDVTTRSRVIARAATGKRGVLREHFVYDGVSYPAYHGATPQWMKGKKGITLEESDYAGYLYNDLDSVEKAIASLNGDVAVIYVGACSYPYSAPTVEPTAEFARGLRKIAHRIGAMLVVDEIRTNMRMLRGDSNGTPLESSWVKVAGLEAAPDMYCLCKAIANNHPLSALIGAESAREGAIAATGTCTYWLAAPPMAASLATLDILEKEDVMGKMERMGTLLADGLVAAAEKHGLAATVSGPVSLPYFTFDNETPYHRPLGEMFCAEMAGRGVWIHPHHNWYLSAAHEESDIKATLEAADGAFEVVAAAQTSLAKTV